jgi:four helix bundle protein
MKIQRFEDIIAWQKTVEFTVKVYSTFRYVTDYSFKDQIQRAVFSISNNIAEGFNRKGNKEFIRYLYISISSAGEVKSMLYVAAKLNYLNAAKAKELLNEIDEISRIIRGFIKSLERQLSVIEKKI